jgi:hypothetical protein
MDIPSGLTLMGARLYDSNTGRFFSVDTVFGGNENAYTYPNDPVNTADLDGLTKIPKKKANRCLKELGWCTTKAKNVFDLCKAFMTPYFLCELAYSSMVYRCHAIYKKCLNKAFRKTKKVTIQNMVVRQYWKYFDEWHVEIYGC